MEKYKNERRAFMALVNDLCRVLSYPDIDEPIRDDQVLVMEMMLDGISFNVSHSFVNAQQRIRIEAIFGEMPADRVSQVLYRLLHLNRELSEFGNSSLGYDSTRSKIIYSHVTNLASLDGQGLLNVMTEIAWRAKYWRENYFLSEDIKSDAFRMDGRLIPLA